MFLGHFRHAVDAKGRVAVPATFRRDLAHGAVLSPGQEGRLVIWPEEAWGDYVRRYRMAAPTRSDERAFMRILFARSKPVELDAQGRILFGDDHRRFAGIGDTAVFVGMGDCVEVVGEAVWDREQEHVDAGLFTELGDRINQPGAQAPEGT